MATQSKATPSGKKATIVPPSGPAATPYWQHVKHTRSVDLALIIGRIEDVVSILSIRWSTSVLNFVTNS